MANPMTEASKILKSKVKGEQWALAALPVLCEAAREIKEIEARVDAECQPHKDAVKKVKDQYAASLEALAAIDTSLRDRVKIECADCNETLKVEGEGELIFPTRWTFTVVDVKRVPLEYKAVDSTLINAEIRKGIRNIPGIKIEQTRSLMVKPERKEE